MTRTPRRGGRLLISAVDLGSGINPRSIRVIVGSLVRQARYDARRRLIVVSLGGVSRGRRLVEAEVSDYQESKNQENVARILPNTSRLRATIVRPLAVSVARRRQLRQVALDAGCELVDLVVGPDDPQLLLAARPRAQAPMLRADAGRKAWPLGSDQHCHGTGEQDQPEPGHASIVATVRGRSP